MTSASDDCHIVQLPAPRFGKTKYWCVSHEASATARYGRKLPCCEGAYQTIPELKTLPLNPDAFPGGVALWGAVEPVYNSTGLPAESGIHVHARSKPNGKKSIDLTYDAVNLTVRRDLFEEEKVWITGATAVAYYLTRFLGLPITTIFCPYCRTPHLDSDWFAVKIHKTHLCHGCNRLFKQDTRMVSNPLEAARHKLLDHDAARKPRRAKRSISIRQTDYPGGLQIWASNPALLWTAAKAEDEGIHVHGWNGKRADPKLDGTFDSLTVDGITLNENHLRHYMAQRSLVYLRNKIVSLDCPVCGAAQFDEHISGFRPKKHHKCHECGNVFATPGRRKLVVCNPFINTLKALGAAKRGTKVGGI